MSSADVPPPCSLPLADADFGLDNVNWTKGLQAMSDWIWSANLNPAAFPNNLGRYFLQIPAIFEQQLAFSTTLLFDEPSFRNGQQISGFIPRPIRELVINLIGHRRRARYTITHHAILGTLTARKHGIADSIFAAKLVALTDHMRAETPFTPLERAILEFADHFGTLRLGVMRRALRLGSCCAITTAIITREQAFGCNASKARGPLSAAFSRREVPKLMQTRRRA
jgi:hypothetical protein